MNEGLIAFIVIMAVVVFILLLIVICNIKIVKQTEKIIVERLGEIGRAHV